MVVTGKPMAGSVIQSTWAVEFEDGLRTGVLLGGCGYFIWTRMNSNPLLNVSWSWTDVAVIWAPVRPNFNLHQCSGIKLQLLELNQPRR